MFSKIRNRLTYANVAVTFALVLAMSGGAYAAGRYVIVSTKQISPKVLKALTGKPGANGAPGTSGAGGPAGPQGSQGPQGPSGAKGETGPAGPEGAKGAIGPKGATGAAGTTGFTETLPSGKTLKGEWVVHTHVGEGVQTNETAVSFGIPLNEAPTVHLIDGEHELTASGEATPTECPGSVSEPTANAGNLCVYEGVSGNLSTNATANEFFFGGWKWGIAIVNPNVNGHEHDAASPFGFGVSVITTEEGSVAQSGSWAVTAK